MLPMVSRRDKRLAKHCCLSACPRLRRSMRRRGSRACALPLPPVTAQSSPGAEAFRVIEADLGAISPGWAAAGGGHGRLAEGERAFCTIMCTMIFSIYAHSLTHNQPSRVAFHTIMQMFEKCGARVLVTPHTIEFPSYIAKLHPMCW